MKRQCRCSPRQIEQYRQRISGPLLDRIDIHCEVPLVDFRELSSVTNTGEKSETIRGRVVAARHIQNERFRKSSNSTNASMSPRQMKVHCQINAEDFMFELTQKEAGLLVSQTVIPGLGKLGGAVPMAFTEQGVAMLSSVLRSTRAVEVNIAIMRAFVRLRQMLATHKDLAGKLEEMEKKYDGQFRLVFDAIRQLMTPPTKPAREIGFHTISKPAKKKKN